jgi:hypothetical protein
MTYAVPILLPGFTILIFLPEGGSVTPDSERFSVCCELSWRSPGSFQPTCRYLGLHPDGRDLPRECLRIWEGCGRALPCLKFSCALRCRSSTSFWSYSRVSAYQRGLKLPGPRAGRVGKWSVTDCIEHCGPRTSCQGLIRPGKCKQILGDWDRLTTIKKDGRGKRVLFHHALVRS